MQLDRLKELAAALGVKLGKLSGDKQLMGCPLARWTHEKGTDKNPSMQVSVTAGPSVFKCWSCKFHGYGPTLVHTLAFHCKAAKEEPKFDLLAANQIIQSEVDEASFVITGEYAEKSGGPPVLSDFSEAWLATFPTVHSSDEALSYLLGREGGPVPLSIAERLDLRWDGHEKRVCFPVRDFGGVLRGLHGRAVGELPEGEPKYRMYRYAKKNNPVVWLGEAWVDFDRPVVMVEGPFDLTRVMQVYDNVVSPLSANFSHYKLMRMSPAFIKVLMFDQDKAGKAADDALREAFPKSITKSITLSGNDPGQTDAVTLARKLAPHVDVRQIILD